MQRGTQWPHAAAPGGALRQRGGGGGAAAHRCVVRALVRDSSGYLPLHLTCKNWSANQADIVAQLLDAQPETITMRDPSGHLPLHIAASSFGRTETVRTLVTRWPESVALRTRLGLSALELANQFGMPDQILELLQDGLTGSLY
mmetsp:Transcript_66313/g.198102  ORF Transcript_66313/g.198102 Transcript_66313/m.198102 type:complete len:144 (+) Transcript_66313:115-546(+)